MSLLGASRRMVARSRGRVGGRRSSGPRPSAYVTVGAAIVSRLRHTRGELEDGLSPHTVRAAQGLALTRLGSRSALRDWRRFFGSTYRRFQLVALAQGLVMALVGADVIITFLLTLGLPAALVALAVSLPAIGAAGQLAVPRLLRASGGNLRRLTILALIGGVGAGLMLVGVAVGVHLRLLSPTVAALLVLTALAFGGMLTNVGRANLQAWYHVILSEPERRFIGPRMSGLAIGISAVLLFPLALLLDAMISRFGPATYVVMFAAASVAGAAEVAAVWRLPHPGRVRVPRRVAQQDANGPALSRFISSMTLSSLGGGLQPWLSLYAMGVAGSSAGFAVLLAAIGAGASLLTVTVAGAFLSRGSSSRLLRLSLVSRVAAVVAAVVAVPMATLMVPALIIAAVLFAAGNATGALAATERLFRLASGPSAIVHQGRYVARTSASYTLGQLAGSAAIGLGASFGYLTYALLFIASGAIRAATAARLDVSATWLTPQEQSLVAEPESARLS